MKNVKINGQIKRKHKKPSVLIIFGTGIKLRVKFDNGKINLDF